jgi:hypothetical protein
MAFSLAFNIGRLLGRNEKLTTAKINAIVKGMSATLTGTVGTAEIADAAVTPAKVVPGPWWYAAAAMAGSTYVASYTPPVTAYVDGLFLCFKTDVGNTGVTNFDAGLGAKTLRKYGGQVLVGGDIAAGAMVMVRYNSTLVAGGCWEIMSLLTTGTALPDGYLTADAAGRAKMASDYVNADKIQYGATVLGTTGSVTIDWSVAITMRATLTGNVTFDFSNAKEGQDILLAVTQSAGGSNTVSWTPAIKWKSGAVPVLTATANKTDVFGFLKVGGIYYGNVTQNY